MWQDSSVEREPVLSVTDASDLLDLEERGWMRLQDAFATIAKERFEDIGVTPEWSAKDVTHHIAYWLEDAANALEAMREGTWEPVIETDDYVEATNQAEGRRSKTISPGEVRVYLVESRDRLRFELGAMSEVDGEAAEWFEEAAHMHYEEHSADLEAFGSSG